MGTHILMEQVDASTKGETVTELRSSCNGGLNIELEEPGG